MFCVDIRSDGLQCAFAMLGVVLTRFLSWVLSLLRVKEIEKING